MKRVLLGVDVGGTTTAAGLVTAAGHVLVEERAPTHHAGPRTANRTIVELIGSLRRRAARDGLAIEGIGVGVPGIVDAASGRIGDEAPHVPDLAGQPLGARLGKRFGLPVFVDNDVNALALAEFVFGHGRRARSLVVLAPGTGFGAGVVLDGHLVRGAHGFGGEFGHAPVKFDGPPCWCGGRGCLALYASGRGIAEAARARVASTAGAPLLAAAGGDPAAITAPLVFRAAEAGDAVAVSVVDEACRALGAMLGVIVNGLNPEVVVITGGVAASLAPLERRILGAAGEYAFRRALVRTRVVITPADKRVTMRGAAALVLYERELARGRARERGARAAGRAAGSRRRGGKR
ncbi:MAG: ROK family protein [Candidatus Rokubacteria bacterium]|nr:ROK family protein [Candidatus Rokubacteria bacterium]